MNHSTSISNGHYGTDIHKTGGKHSKIISSFTAQEPLSATIHDTTSFTEEKHRRMRSKSGNFDEDETVLDDAPRLKLDVQKMPAGGFNFAYDCGDEPEEEDDEMRNSDDEDEDDEQDDILIVDGEGEEDEIYEESSPEFGPSSPKRERATSNCAGEITKNVGKGLTPVNKSLSTSQEGVRTQLYGGDIYLLGGNHLIISDQEKKGLGPGNKNDSNSDMNNLSTAPSGFTAGLSEFGKARGLSVSTKKRTNGRKSQKKTKYTKLQKVQERNQVQEEDDKTEFDDDKTNTIQDTDAFETKTEMLVTLQKSETAKKPTKDPALMTDKERKRANRDEFLHRPPNQIVTLIKSQFPTREPVVFFPYAPFLGQQRQLPNEQTRIVQYHQDHLKPYKSLVFKVSESTHIYNCVVNSLKMAGFRYMQGAGSNIIWTGLFK